MISDALNQVLRRFLLNQRILCVAYTAGVRESDSAPSRVRTDCWHDGLAASRWVAADSFG
jgi:hypothetical protein